MALNLVNPAVHPTPAAPAYAAAAFPDPFAAPDFDSPVFEAPEAAALAETAEVHAAHLQTAHEPLPLLSGDTSVAVHASFEQLAVTIMAQNAAMVEDSIRGMLRPMLKSWLDDNLPVIVERLVRGEIERVARGGR